MVTEKKAEGWIDDLVGALCDPIIVYPSPWKDDLPIQRSRNWAI